MNRKWITAFFNILYRKLVKIMSVSLIFFALIFFWYFMKHADDTGIGIYYKFTHFFENAYFYTAQYPGLYISNSISNLFRPKLFYFAGAADSSSSINLRWGATNIYIVSFELERSSPKENRFTRIGRFIKFTKQFEDKGLAPGTRYQYRIKACGLLKCGDSKTVEAMTFNAKPAPVSELQVKRIGDVKAELTWQSNCGYAKGFEVEKEIRGEFKSIAKMGPDQTSLVDCPVLPGAASKYRVKTFDEHYVSENNPVVSIDIPDLEKIGETKSLSGVVGKGAVQSIIWNGKEWAIAFSEETKDQQFEKKNDMEINTEIYFQRLDEEFNPIGEKTRVSFDPCMSEHPSIAWNGKEYGIVWSDSRVAKPYCWEGGDSFVRKEVFFARISMEGRRLGQEVRIPSKQEMNDYQMFFWKNDHYDLFYAGLTDILYQSLDANGKPLTKPFPVGDIWGWDVTVAGDHYGITWISTNNRDQSILYFLDFNPASQAEIKPIKIARSVGAKENEGCLIKYENIGAPSVFWTGAQFGVCYRNCHADTEMAMIPPESKLFRTFVALPATNYRCSEQNADNPNSWLYGSSTKCAWNGSEIALLAAQNTIRGDSFGLVRLSPEGVQAGKTKYLDLSSHPWSFPIAKLYWHKSFYFTFNGNSVILLKP